jgi:hypothetical protein
MLLLVAAPMAGTRRAAREPEIGFPIGFRAMRSTLPRGCRNFRDTTIQFRFSYFISSPWSWSETFGHGYICVICWRAVEIILPAIGRLSGIYIYILVRRPDNTTPSSDRAGS